MCVSNACLHGDTQQMAETFYFLGGSLLRLAFTRNRKRDNVKSGVAATLCNRPFPNSCLPPLQSESKLL